MIMTSCNKTLLKHITYLLCATSVAFAMHVIVTLINIFYQSSHFEGLRTGLSVIERCGQAPEFSRMSIGIPS